MDLVIFNFLDVLVADAGGWGDRTATQASANVGDLRGRERWTRAFHFLQEVGELGLGADMAIGREVVDDFERNITTEDDDGI